MKTLLGVPVWVENIVRGALYVTDRADDQEFDDGDQVVLTLLARHAASVIQARWY
jgi:GAF domain-containing protein